MNIVAKTKKMIIMVALVLLTTFILHAEGGFTKVWDHTMLIQTPYGFRSPIGWLQFGNLTHIITNSAPYLVINHDGIRREIGAFEAGIPELDNWNPLGFISKTDPVGIKYPDIIKAERGLFFIDNLSTFPVFRKYMSYYDLPEFAENTDQYGSCSGFLPACFQYGVQLCYTFYSDQSILYKLDYDMKELLDTYMFPKPYRNVWGTLGQAIGQGLNNNLWILTGADVGLLEFDIINERWKVYDSTNLPIKWFKQKFEQQPDSTVKLADGYQGHYHHGMSRYFTNGQPMLPIYAYYTEGNDTGNFSNHYTDNAILYCSYYSPFGLHQWDTVRIDLTEAAEYFGGFPNMYTISSFAVIYPTRKLLINFRCPWQGKVPILLKHFMIYDWDTKTYQMVAPDDSLFTFPNPSLANMTRGLGVYKNKDGIDGIGVLYPHLGDFFFYNPYTGIFELEVGFSDLWFRNVYPNPSSQDRTITTDIMCYVSDISKIDIGLYDILGSKLLDLTDKYEYDASTNTINLTFTIPFCIPSGTYYLNVNNGTEQRTKPIVIGE